MANWTDDQIITAFTAGLRPDGRRLAPIMPWQALTQLSPDDAHAIVAYLRSLPAVKNAVPGPFGPKEVPSTLVFVIVPGEVYSKLPAPPNEPARAARWIDSASRRAASTGATWTHATPSLRSRRRAGGAAAIARAGEGRQHRHRRRRFADDAERP